jgi:hypothetical protein
MQEVEKVVSGRRMLSIVEAEVLKMHNVKQEELPIAA